MALQKVTNIGVKVADTMTPSIIYNPTPVTTGKSSSGSGNGGDPTWLKALYALGSLSKPITQQFANMTDDVKGNSNPFKMLVKNVAYEPNKAFFDSIFQDGFQWGDLKKMESKSTFDILSHMGKNMAGFDQTIGNLGVKNPYVKGIGGFIGDVAFDPTTYLSFGAAPAIKAGAKAMQGTVKTLAKESAIHLGDDAAKTLAKTSYKAFPEKAGEEWFKMAMEVTGDEKIAAIARDKAITNYAAQISDAGKLARSTAQNSIVSFDIPFTNITYQFGKKPDSIAKASPKIAQAGANSLSRTLSRAGLVGEDATKFVSKALGKTVDLKDVTLQEFRWLQSEAGKYADFAASALPKSVDFNSAGAASLLDDFQPGKFVPEMGGSSPVGQKVADRFSFLNPRAVGTSQSGGLVNSYGNAIQDTFSRIRNNSRAFDEEAKLLNSIESSFNPREMDALWYTLEGKAPQGFSTAGLDMDKINSAADVLRPGYARIAEAEKAVGALDKTMPNYAAHVINRTPKQVQDILAKYADDPELQKLAQIAGTSGFNQSRKTFKTMADMDNYLASVSHQLANATDPAEIARLSQKLDDVGNLFERNPFTAYKKRLYKSFKVRELGKLYRQMETDSLLLTPDALKELGGIPTGFVKLDASEAAKLNVSSGSVMHKEVKDALLKVDKLFTDKELNKFLDSVTSITNMWKALATSFRPAHHVNNLVGNVLNNSLAGVGPSAYKKATTTLNRAFRGKPKQEDLKLIQEAIQNGIFGQVHSDEYIRLFGNQSASTLRKMEKMVTDNRFVKFMRKWLGDSTDNWSRLAHFIAIKEKTGSAELAAESVRKYLFNYGEQTATDKTMRMLVPFWMWTKNNIPLQIENLLKQPRYAQTYLRLQDTSYAMHGEKREDQADFISEGYFMTPWANTALSENTWLGDLRNPRAPLADLNNLERPFQFLGESSNPLLRVPFFEVPQNRQMFTQRPIDYQYEQTGERDWGAWAKYGLGQAAFANDIFKLGSGSTNPFDFLFGRELDMRRD